MANQDTFIWEQTFLGEHIEYPGHPVVLAAMIMDRYPNLDAAVRRENGREFGNALSDIFIPGAGCAVYSALETLRQAQSQGLEAAYAHAKKYWEGWEQQSPKNTESAAKGLSQFEKIKERFATKLKVWGTASDLDSRFRIATTVDSDASSATPMML